MDNHHFDNLLRALQETLVSAQDGLRKRNEAVLRRRDTPQDNAVLTFAIPRTPADEGEREMLSLPAASFRSPCCRQISMLSLEFQCRLTQSLLSGIGRRYYVQIANGKTSRWWRKAQVRMQILFMGMDHPCGEVLVEGKHFMEIPSFGAESAGPPEITAKRSKFSLFMDCLLNLWRPQRFILTREQSDCLRKILKQQPKKSVDGETAAPAKTTPGGANEEADTYGE